MKNELLDNLKRVKEVIVARLTSTMLDAEEVGRLTLQLREINTLVEEQYAGLEAVIRNNIDELAQHEAEFNRRLFNRVTTKDVEFVLPAREQLLASVMTKPLNLLDDSLNVDAALKEFTKKKRNQIIAVINDGILLGRSQPQVVEDLTILTDRVQPAQLGSLARTLTNHTNTVARDILMQQNDDVIEGVEWVSTLDGSTTESCAAIDGQVFPSDQGPRPPLHWGCRSVVIPKIKEQYDITRDVKTERPASGPEGPSSVSSKTTYQSWLKKQPKSFQEDVLGKTKAKLFRQGGLSLDKFVDENYRPLTLNELKSTQTLAFERAGLLD